MAANHVTLIGNLVDDPELRFTPSGVAMAKIRFAVNRRYQDRNGEWQEDTSFFGGTLWRDAAENCAESLSKGTRVIVTGRLEHPNIPPVRSQKSHVCFLGRRPPRSGARRFRLSAAGLFFDRGDMVGKVLLNGSWSRTGPLRARSRLGRPVPPACSAEHPRRNRRRPVGSG